MSTRKYRHHKRPHWQPAFLAALSRTGIVNQAADAAGVHIATVFRARDTRNRQGDSLAEAQKFAKDWDHALERAADRVENEIFRRAIDGVERTYDVYYKGEKIGTRTVLAYSDRLLMFLAKALRPGRFGPHSNIGNPDSWDSAKQQSNLEEAKQRAEERWKATLPLLVQMVKSGDLELTRESDDPESYSLRSVSHDSPEYLATHPNFANDQNAN